MSGLYVTPQPLSGQGPVRNLPAAGQGGSPSAEFRELLKSNLQASREVTFSGHAKTRLASRNIEIGAGEMKAINEAAARAEAKGARNALIVSDRFGLITNIPNRTVITALDPRSMNENIVTNIDSAVFL